MSEAAHVKQTGRIGGRLVEPAGRAVRGFARTVDNAINPIVVKELRQAVNGRFVGAALTLFLGISVVTIAVALIDSGGRIEAEAGRDVLVVLNATLLGVCLLLLPLQAGWRFASERSDQNVDLMFITTIAPRSIIAGKLAATVILAGLIYAACLPFMTLTYLLRGVDLPTILLMVVIGFAVVVGGIMLALFAASAPMHRGFRVLMAVGVLGLLAVTYQGLIGWSAASLHFGLFSARLGPAELWGWLLAAGLLFFSAVYLLFRFAVAMISAPTSNRVLPVRLAMMGVWVVFTGVMWPVVFLVSHEDPLVAWYIVSVLLFSLGLVIAVCERERWGPRVARTIPDRGLARLGALLLYSGAANGLLWAASMILLTTAAYLAFPWLYDAVGSGLFGVMPGGASGRSIRDDPDFREALRIALGLAGYIYTYAMAGLLVRRYLLKGAVPPAHTWAIGLVLAGLGLALPPMFAFILHGNLAFTNGVRWWMLGNPASLFDEAQASASPIFVGSCAIVLTILALPWALDQLAAFRPGGARMTDDEVADAGGRIARQALTIGGMFTGLAALGVWVGWLRTGWGWVGWLTVALLLLTAWAWLAGRRPIWRRRWGRPMGRAAAIALLPLAPVGTAAGLTSLIAARRARRAEAALTRRSTVRPGMEPALAGGDERTPPEATADDEAAANG